jgi:hypothetical protein
MATSTGANIGPSKKDKRERVAINTAVPLPHYFQLNRADNTTQPSFAEKWRDK